MLIKRRCDIKGSEITDKKVYLNRRQFLMGASVTAAAVATGLVLPAVTVQSDKGPSGAKLDGVRKSPFSTDEEKTPFKDITNYNNFYEFGTDKYSPAKYAKSLVIRPWTVAVEGEIKREKVFDIDELMKMSPLEERIYRLRCVEAWSMVIPWVGFPLSALIKKVEPTSKAKYECPRRCLPSPGCTCAGTPETHRRFHCRRACPVPCAQFPGPCHSCCA